MQKKNSKLSGKLETFQQKTASYWIKRLQELSEGYSIKRISNMDKSGFFFKALHETGLGQKGKQAKIGKKAKQHLTIAFLSL